ncbi:MAG: type III pantothenate kinase [Oscillospiraceae bacterium]|nr:type III pantothenate kinase [Oscillospiraceae bacterium]
MLLTLDIGNTQINIGVWEGDVMRFSACLATDRGRTGDQYALEIKMMLESSGIFADKLRGSAISSVVPELTPMLTQAAGFFIEKQPIVLGPGVKTGLHIKVDNPAQVGADMVAAAVSAKERYPLPCLIADLGTATKLIVLDAKGAFCGCAIAPGVGISLDALSARASQLPAISFANLGRSIGTNTVDSMRSGIVYGTAAMLDGMTQRMENELRFGYSNKSDAAVSEGFSSLVATGGLSENIVKHCVHNFRHEPDLVLDGLRRVYNRAQEDG